MVHRSISSTPSIFNDKHSDFSFRMFLFTMVGFLVETLHRHYKPYQVSFEMRPN